MAGNGKSPNWMEVDFARKITYFYGPCSIATFDYRRVSPISYVKWFHVEVSWNGSTSKSSIDRWIFKLCKPSTDLVSPFFWKPPYVTKSGDVSIPAPISSPPARPPGRGNLLVVAIFKDHLPNNSRRHDQCGSCQREMLLKKKARMRTVMRTVPLKRMNTPIIPVFSLPLLWYAVIFRYKKDTDLCAFVLFQKPQKMRIFGPNHSQP